MYALFLQKGVLSSSVPLLLFSLSPPPSPSLLRLLRRLGEGLLQTRMNSQQKTERRFFSKMSHSFNDNDKVYVLVVKEYFALKKR